MTNPDSSTTCNRCGRKLKDPNNKNPYLPFRYGSICGRYVGIDLASGKPVPKKHQDPSPKESSYLPTKGTTWRMSYVPRHNPSAVGWCYVTEIIDKDGSRHVLFTEPNDNSGMSITNASEDVSSQYIHRTFGDEIPNLSRIYFYESYENGGLAGGGVDKIEYIWEPVSRSQKRYGLPWRWYPRGLAIIAYNTEWSAGTKEDEDRFGLPPRPNSRML